MPAAQYLRQLHGAELTIEKIRKAALEAGGVVVGDEIIITATDYTAIEGRILDSMKDEN